MIRKNIIKFALFSTFVLTGISAKAGIVSDFCPARDSLTVLLKERNGIEWSNKSTTLEITKIVKRGTLLDFYFKRELGDFPWHDGDVEWLQNTLNSLYPEAYKTYTTGQIYVSNKKLQTLVTPVSSNDGIPKSFKHTTQDQRLKRTPLVREIGTKEFSRGLSGRTIALWHSHGRYYNEKDDRWVWQRAPIHTTVEDMFTQSFVLPFLIPMLENSGAYVLDPRERDPQKMEYIIDNDPDFSDTREGMVRRSGFYAENGKWSGAGTGFADAKETYLLEETPFTMGTARKAEGSTAGGSTIKWTPDILQRGFYSVYVSYKSLPESTDAAHYKVRYMGGERSFLVNQKIGGGTWIYLGTFEFDKGTAGYVELDNICKGTVSADAVKIGGGMGKYARGPKGGDTGSYSTSGMPAFAEGALYWMRWAGTDSTVTAEWDDDYTKDYAGRGNWVSWMCGGSDVNPQQKGKGVPIDLSLAIHSDAGTAASDTTIGTLVIYSGHCEDKTAYPDGRARLCSRTLADLIQTQICEDIRSSYDSTWSRRETWDRGYSESRRPEVPAVLVEMLSHQNFSDMRLGLDPSFRFTVSRAIYKGALKFLSYSYGCRYCVQPLPVEAFAVKLEGSGKAKLYWKARKDALEPTAEPSGYVLERRYGKGAFLSKETISEIKEENGFLSTEVNLKAGEVNSFRITAFNDGGYSFPSEILSAGVPAGSQSGKTYLIVNDFDRVGAPVWFDTPAYAGFDSRLDSGVGYGSSYEQIGDVYEFRRTIEWLNDDEPGFGATRSDRAGEPVSGNSFDFVSSHATALLKNGRAFCSASAEAFASVPGLADGTKAIDLLCGKQARTPLGSGKCGCRHEVFPEALQEAISSYCAKGGCVIVSGANIGSDVWSSLYHIPIDSTAKSRTVEFVEKNLGYRWHSGYGCSCGKAESVKGGLDCESIEFNQKSSSELYGAENPDGITPAAKEAKTVMRYSDSKISAAVFYKAPSGYKVAAFGFPIECIGDGKQRASLFKGITEFIEN